MTDSAPITTVAAFDDASSARASVDALHRHGIRSEDIHLHEKGLEPRNASGTTIDEYASGGFFTNFSHLLSGLMNTPRQSPSYEELVQFEGVVVSVEMREGDRVERVEDLLRRAGAKNVKSGRGLERP